MAEEEKRMDMVAILLVAGAFGLFYGMMAFCDKVVTEEGREKR
ncbi:hypothetical protein C2W64_02334 [Brevibacillus laterosporus]|nr:hypothetical protein C2W64_02334 [Brevibacillus laterosporus]